MATEIAATGAIVAEVRRWIERLPDQSRLRWYLLGFMEDNCEWPGMSDLERWPELYLGCATDRFALDDSEAVLMTTTTDAGGDCGLPEIAEQAAERAAELWELKAELLTRGGTTIEIVAKCLLAVSTFREEVLSLIADGNVDDPARLASEALVTEVPTKLVAGEGGES